MSVVNARAAYRQAHVATANPAQLAAMLCAGAAKFALQADQALALGDNNACHRHLLKAQGCVMELLVSLDREQGGDLVQSLASLYDFAHQRLIEGNVQKDSTAIQEARKVLLDLHESWMLLIGSAVAAKNPT